MAHTLAAVDQPSERIESVLGHLQHIVPYERCALLEVIPNPERFVLSVVPKPASAELEPLRERLIDLLQLMGFESSSVKEAERQPESVGNRAPGLESTRMHLAIPLVGLNQMIGVLFVEQSNGPTEEPYDEHSVRLLSVVAAQLGAYLTTVRMREEELEHARELGIALRRLEETDRRKDDFLALLGHELRNPIGAINNALRIMDKKSVSEMGRYQQLIDRQIGHLSRIVDDLLDASRVRLGKIVLQCQILDLRSIAERWMDSFGTSPQVQARELELQLGQSPIFIDGDQVRLEQIFSNLMTNALKYSPPAAKIRVTVGVENGQAVIRLKDSGIGMTPEVLASIFELFTQADESLSRSQGGLGLGLPLVRSLVEKHGGTVEASSDGPGRGSEFVVRLPLAAEGQAVESVAPAALAVGLPLRILVIEDNEDARLMLEEMLGLWGHAVESVGDGELGLKRALETMPDVLLVDIGLPKLDGYEVARRVRLECGAKTPKLFAMTGYGQPEDRRRALDAGFDSHLVKPVNVTELRQRLASLQPTFR